MRIAGISMDSAPSASSRGELAGLRSRSGDDDLLAVQRPASSQAIRSRRPATGPTTVTDGGLIPASSAAAAMPSRVEVTVSWPGRVPRSTTAAGSDASRPASISRSAIRAAP